MTREAAGLTAHEELHKHGLNDWHVRQSTNSDSHYLAYCSYKDKCIILNAHHIDIHPDADIVNTIRHEIAHALCPGHGHDETWSETARRIGCDNTQPCSHLSLSPEIIDAIRSGATIEVSYDEHTVRVPKWKVTRLQDKCEECGKVAVTVKETLLENDVPTKPNQMWIKLECGHTIIKLIPKGTPFELFQMGGDETCKHEWDKSKCIKCGRFRPYQFQLEGMRFSEQALAVNSGVAILDEMGLGKTIQALGTVKYHPELWPFICIVKSGLRFPWFKAALDWMGDDFVCQIIQSSKDILIPGLKGYIISYDMLVPKTMKRNGKVITMGFDIDKIIKSPIKCVILDECQHVKNTDASRTQQVRKICKGRKVIALSGTPWKNRGGELFSVMNMIAPMKFPSHQGFLDKWVETYWQGQFRKQGGIRRPKEFSEYIKDIAIRRERSVVMPELPATQRTRLNVNLKPSEEVEMDDATAAFVQWYEEEKGSAGTLAILGKIARLRHLTGVAKIGATMDYLEEFTETDKKIVVFVHHQDVGESIYQQCKEEFENKEYGYTVLQLTSALSGEERFEIQNQFNATQKCIMIASTLASGEGLNLQTCANCIMHERQWNPANEEQAEGRFCRIGQTSPEIMATYVLVVESIDSWLDAIIERKRLWFHTAHNKGKQIQWSQDEIVKDLAEFIVRKHYQKKDEKRRNGAA